MFGSLTMLFSSDGMYIQVSSVVCFHFNRFYIHSTDSMCFKRVFKTNYYFRQYNHVSLFKYSR